MNTSRTQPELPSTESIIDEAYKLYMPQVRSEIIGLTDFIINHFSFDGRNMKPINVLEIGTKYGGTFYIWNQLNELLTSKAWDWDLNDQFSDVRISIDLKSGIHGGIDQESINKRNLYFLERFKNCHFIEGDSHSTTTMTKMLQVFDPSINKPFYEIFPDGLFDLIFIDGDHTYEGVKMDWEMYHPFLKKDGLVAFHDIIDTQRHRDRNVHVAKFWNELKETGLYEVVEIVDGSEDFGGIGIVKI